MATTIITKFGSGAPTASDVVRGELAVDTENGRLYTEDSGGSVVEIGLNPSGNVDVTGTVTADGLTVDGDVNIDDAVPILRLDSPETTWSGGEDLGGIDWYTKDPSSVGPGVMARIYSESTGANTLPIPNLIFQTSLADLSLKDRMKIGGEGDISFYDTAGSNAKLFWDASAESLLLGTDSGDAFNGEALLRMQGATSTYLQMKSATTGTTGILFGDTDDDYTGALLYSAADDALVFTTNNGNERMRIDSSGRLLVGTTSNFGGEALQIDANSVGSTVYTAYISNTNTSTSAYNVMRWGQGAAGSATGMIGTGGSAASNAAFQNTFLVGTQSSNPLVFATADTERMRIDSSGNVSIGGITPTGLLTLGTGSFSAAAANTSALYTSSTAGLVAVADGFLLVDRAGADVFKVDTDGNLLVGTATGFGGLINAPVTTTDEAIVTQSDSTSASTHLNFRNPNGFVGSISTSGTATAYNTSSDYRLKENVVSMSGATERLKQLKPSRFNFIADADTTVDGFLAHEVADVVPEAVTGAKDAVDAEGNPEYQGIDQSKLVPLLVATIQELEARIAQLEGAN